MKVMILTQKMTGGGGAEKVIANLTLQLSDQFDFVLVTPKQPGHHQQEFAHQGHLIQANMRWDAPAANVLDRLTKLVYRAVKLRRIVRQETPDVILSNFTHMWHSAVTVLKLFGLIKAPVILRFGSPISEDLRQRGLIYRLIAWIGLHVTERTIVNSQGLADDIIAFLGASWSKVVTIHNPIAVESIQSLSEDEAPEGVFEAGMPVVLCVGRLAPQKNQALLIRAFAGVKAQADAKLALIGSGPMKQELKDLAQCLGLAEHVLFLGWQENPYKFMSRASMLVLPSDYEGFPSTLVEALACGCPVIATDCPYGSAEILDHGRFGIMAPVGDLEALSRAILRMLQDSGLRESLSRAGRQRALIYDSVTNMDRYGSLFRELAPESGRPTKYSWRRSL